MNRIKVYLYNDNGKCEFIRILDIENIEKMIDIVNELAYNNDNVYSYYIENVDNEI